MEKFNLEYLEQAKDDLKEIAQYISEDLQNVSAAERLIEKIIKSAENITNYPYSNAVYVPLKPLKHEYRKVFVDNFTIFYYVTEERKVVTVSRIVYSRRNLSKQIKP